VREHVRNYLRWCVSDLCRVAQQAIEMRRQRLEQALQGSMNHRASSLDHGYQAASSDDLAQRRDELTQLMEQLTTLRDMLLQHGHLPDEGTTGKQPLEDSDGNINAALPKHLPDVSLITDLQDHAIMASADRAVEETSTCPLCAAVLDAVIRFLSHLQYALATDPATQHEFLAAHGLCIHHTWQLGFSATMLTVLPTSQRRCTDICSSAMPDVESCLHLTRTKPTGVHSSCS